MVTDGFHSSCLCRVYVVFLLWLLWIRKCPPLSHQKVYLLPLVICTQMLPDGCCDHCHLCHILSPLSQFPHEGGQRACRGLHLPSQVVSLCMRGHGGRAPGWCSASPLEHCGPQWSVHCFMFEVEDGTSQLCAAATMPAYSYATPTTRELPSGTISLHEVFCESVFISVLSY